MTTTPTDCIKLLFHPLQHLRKVLLFNLCSTLLLTAPLFLNCTPTNFSSKNSSLNKNSASNGKDNTGGKEGVGTGGGTGNETGNGNENGGQGNGTELGTQNGLGGQGDQEAKSENFFDKSKSLDLYAIFDVSGSLADSSSATDPQCRRWSAFLGFTLSIAKKMNPSRTLRVSLITFSDKANAIGAIDTQLSTYDEDSFKKNLKNQFESKVCASQGQTNPEAAFETTRNVYLQNTSGAGGKKEIETVLFFSDGIPSLGPEWPTLQSVTQSAKNLQQLFGGRIFSILLGETSKVNSLCKPTTSKCQINPVDFVNIVSPQKSMVTLVDSASDLTAAFEKMLNE